MNRRQFVTTVAAAALRLDAQRPRPNILWISCEDSSPALGCYGDKNAITPTLDRLASQGVRFTKAFSVYGVCAPSRSAIITGMYPTTIGTQHMRSTATLPADIKPFPVYLRESGYYCTNNAKTDYNFNPRGVWDESSQKAHWRNRKPGQPFFAVFNFTTTHEFPVRSEPAEYAKHTARLTAAQRQDPVKLRIPAFHPDTPVVRRQWANFYELITAMDYQAAEILDQLEKDGLAQDTIVFFWSDHGTGLARGKRWVYDSGTRVPLIVRIPEKLRVKGQGKPGSADSQLISLIDLGPTVLNLAGLKQPVHMQGRAFLGPALSKPREYVYSARDRMDERYDIIRSVRDGRYRYIRNYESFKPYYQHVNTAELSPVMQELRRVHAEKGLKPEAAQFMAARKPVEELYDSERDRDEVQNLAGSASHRGILARMRKAHEQWMDETRDLGLIPESEIAREEKAAGTRYAILKRTPLRNVRLREVIKAGESGDIARLTSAIDDRDPAVRYWAVTWLGERKQGAEQLKPLLQDSSPAVRVAAARSLVQIGAERELAAAVLSKELRSGTEWSRLAAALAMDDLGLKDKAGLEHALALKDTNQYVGRVARHALDE